MEAEAAGDHGLGGHAAGEEVSRDLLVAFDSQSIRWQPPPETQQQILRAARQHGLPVRLPTLESRRPVGLRSESPPVAGVGRPYADLPGDRRREPSGQHPGDEHLEHFVHTVSSYRWWDHTN